jgi:hypothetical protein
VPTESPSSRTVSWDLGTHDEQIAEQGAYAELWESWGTDGASG